MKALSVPVPPDTFPYRQKSDFLSTFHTVRFGESALLQGTPFFGLAFGLVHWTQHWSSVAWMLLGSFLLTNGVFLLNDIADLRHDREVLRKQPRVMRLQRLGNRRLGSIAALCGIGGIVVIAELNVWSAIYAAGVFLAGIAYSVPLFRFKERPVISSLTHLFGGMLHFMVGYSLGAGPFLHGIMIGTFFAAVFMAGHLIHELRDYEGDTKTGVLTNACRFGRRPTFLASLALFVLLPLYAVLIACLGFAPSAFMVAALSIPVVLYASRGLLRRSFDISTVRRFQTVYRLTYIFLGGYWLVALA